MISPRRSASSTEMNNPPIFACLDGKNSSDLVVMEMDCCERGVVRMTMRGRAKDLPKVLRFSIDINSCFEGDCGLNDLVLYVLK